VDAVWRADYTARISGPMLEMITRDPLEIPGPTEKYWTTFDDLNGVHLARTLSQVRANNPGSRCLASAA
jgi:hypothetical protein